MTSKRKTQDAPSFDENPEWTKADFAKARLALEVFPPEVYRRLIHRRKTVTSLDGPGRIAINAGESPP